MSKNSKAAIYRITNKVNGRYYIGSSVDVYKRRSKHFSKLRTGKHCNAFLLADFRKYGERNFTFEVLEFVNSEEKNLLEVEQQYIDAHFSDEKCYNLAPIAGSTLGYKHPPETIEKISGENHQYYGVTGSQHPKSKKVYQFSLEGNFIAEYESLTKAAKATKTYVRGISSVCNGTLSSANGYLWSFSKDPQPVYHVRNNKKAIEQLSKDKTCLIRTFESISEAARETGINPGDISKVCNGHTSHAGGYVWKFVDRYK